MVILKFRITSFLVARDPRRLAIAVPQTEGAIAWRRMCRNRRATGNDFALASNDLFAPCDMTADHRQMVQIPIHVSYDSRSLSWGLAFALPVWCNVTRDDCRADGMAVAKKSKSEFDPRAFLAKADGGVTVSNYSKGQVVFTQGEPADSVFYIQEGKVKIAVVSAQGKEAVVAFLTAGDFIGEGCLTGRPRRISGATALTDCTLTRVDKRSRGGEKVVTLELTRTAIALFALDLSGSSHQDRLKQDGCEQRAG
jgi:hypothetical protein